MLDILLEICMLGCRPVDFPINPNSKLLIGLAKLLDNPGQYRRLGGKLNYLTVSTGYWIHGECGESVLICFIRYH